MLYYRHQTSVLSLYEFTNGLLIFHTSITMTAIIIRKMKHSICQAKLIVNDIIKVMWFSIRLGSFKGVHLNGKAEAKRTQHWMQHLIQHLSNMLCSFGHPVATFVTTSIKVLMVQRMIDFTQQQ